MMSVSGGLKLSEKLLVSAAIVLVVGQLVDRVQGYPYPHYGHHHNDFARRQDSSGDPDGDEEEMDTKASAPYQNQNQNSGGDGGDGYEPPDKDDTDASYSETPREEEGQADLERFFDDHLGASEREGMDKENLPTNAASTYTSPDESVEMPILAHAESLQSATVVKAPAGVDYMVASPNVHYIDHREYAPNVETRYIKLPNDRLIITRQTVSGDHANYRLGRPVYRGGVDAPARTFTHIHHRANSNPARRMSAGYRHRAPQMMPRGGGIVATQNDDAEKIYVTNDPNKPFKIPDMGGYDPEEDFNNASRDLDGTASSGNKRSGKERAEPMQPVKDISFNDDDDELFEAASDSDEVTFSHDPYQTDLEEELQSPQKSRNAEQDDDAEDDANPASTNQRSVSEEDNEGSWINDGADEMEVPSQAHQDRLLKKAEEAELAKQRAAAEAESAPDSQQDESGAGDNQRMPNADYMKDDLKFDDDDFKSK